MKQHRYRLRLEHLPDAKGQPIPDRSAFNFEVGNHDDLFRIIDLMRGRPEFDEATATAFAVGLKLFGEVMLEHPDLPLFEEMRPQFLAFMKRLKGSMPQAAQAAPVD